MSDSQIEERLGIGVMARSPTDAGGKTRLRVAHDAAFVTELSSAMLADTLAALGRLSAAARVVFVSPTTDGDAALAIRPFVPTGWRVVVQEGEDLGARILHALGVLAASGASRFLITGSDAPTLGRVLPTFPTIADDEVLLVPTEDGGYAAIALARVEATLFESMRWSHSGVAAETQRRAAAAGMRVRSTEMIRDVDEPTDLERLRRDLAADPTPAPHTAAWLSRSRDSKR